MSDSTATKRPPIRLTQREMEVVVAALQNLKSGDIKINYAEMAKALGLKNDKTATAVWCSVKKKLFNDGTSTPSVRKPKPKASDVNGVTKSTPQHRQKSTATTPVQDSALQIITATGSDQHGQPRPSDAPTPSVAATGTGIDTGMTPSTAIKLE